MLRRRPASRHSQGRLRLYEVHDAQTPLGLEVVCSLRSNHKSTRVGRRMDSNAPSKFCWVREWCRHHSLPLEPDVRVSPHPARAVTKLRVRGTSFQDGVIPASCRVIPNFLRNARSRKY